MGKLQWINPTGNDRQPGVKIYKAIPDVLFLGLGHRARQGKDVAAQALVDHVPGARRYAFSDAIAVYCRVCHGMTTRSPWLLQQVGLEMRVTSNPSWSDVWLDALYWRIDEERPALAIITGVRFPDEASMIRQCGGMVWRIDRFTPAGKPFVATDRDPNHETETALDHFEFDAVLKNTSGEVESFKDSVITTYARHFEAST